MNSDEEVKVVYDASDFRALYRACERCRRNAIRIVIILPIVFGFLAYTGGYRGMDLAFQAIPFLLTGLVAVLGLYFVGPWNAVRIRRKNGWAEPMTVSFTGQGIATRHPNQDSLFFWSKILNVVAQGPRLFIFTTPGCAIMLPRRCFASDRQFADWIQRARDYWKQATPRNERNDLADKSVTVE